ncbi:reverse transcriptase [Tanacetum coccineum]
MALVNAQLLEFDRVVTTKQPLCNRPTSQSSPGWIPPPPHSPLVKINCGAAFKDSTAAIAIVGRDSLGSISHVYGTPCYASSPLHAEIFAIHSACHLALCRGWYHAIVAISFSSTDTVPPWSIDALVANIRLWSKNMDLTFSWTSRHNNKVAHYAARLASSSTFCFSWDVSFPVELTSLARSDVYCS